MLCPACRFDNIPGVDNCEQCMNDLSSLDEPAGETPIEDSLISEPTRSLDPKTAVTVPPDATVSETLDVLVEKNIGCVLVVAHERGHDRVRGIFSERDALLRVSGRLDEVRDRPISDFMTSDPETLDEGAPLAYALNKMSVGDFRHLPLTSGGESAGIISLRDFLGFVFRWYPDLARD